jgi:photosystem II stability/assembly factor-like uncharacterized protein
MTNMRPIFLMITFVFCTSVALGQLAQAQEKKKESDEDEPKNKLATSTLSALSFRSIGPALMSGRIADVAIDFKQPNTWYVAVGSGNVWKTVNAGTTWKPIFDKYGSYSIGCITIDPNDRHTIWVGTGENVGGRHVGYGDGVYVSHDGGASFRNVGLKESEHISKIVIDPRDSKKVFVAAQGPLWSSGGERGLYRSTNGGESWKAVLTKGKWTGVTDVVIDPKNPDVMYAATHQRHRTVWGLVNGGPESRIHKSTDGGQTWKQLRGGLPSGDIGKMSVAVSPQKTNVVYAAIELPGRKGGVWRSANRGASWKKMSDYVAGGTGPHYYQEIYCDPHRFDVLYHANVRLGRSEDGGATFDSLGSRNKHVDNHAVAFHPTEADFLLIGCDGGLYRSFDYAKTYDYFANLPLTQFYKLDVDYDEPFYHVVGGTQDNNTQYGPTRTRDSAGIRNANWRITIGGDGHDCAIDPEDPNIIYGESQQGFLRRFDRRTGESIDIRPQPEKDEGPLRFNWDSPILISPHSHTRLYFGSRRLHRSDDRGDSWRTISPDLSRSRDRFTLPYMGRVWSLDAAFDLDAMSDYGNITSVSESPLVEGLIYVGTDDGLIQVTEDGGETWRKVDKIYGLPEYAFVNDIKADRHDEDTVYAVFDNHKEGDFQPYVMRSDDRGETWESIRGDLKDRQIVWRIEQDHVQKELLFLGTEFGVFYTRDSSQREDGIRWIKLPGTPVIPFRDLAIQRRENDLVGASFGRGFYVLDDYAPLREIDDEMLKENDFKLFPVRTAKQYIQERVLGGGKGTQGDGYYTASNPPYGAIFTYYMKESIKTAKEQRKKREAKLRKADKDIPAPDADELEKEDREEKPEIVFTVTDGDGSVVDRVTSAASSGTHRVAWNLRYGSLTGGEGPGPLAPPGTYTVQASKRVDGQYTDVGEPQEFEIVFISEPTLEAQPREEVFQFQTDVAKLMQKVRAASRRMETTLKELVEIKRVVRSSREVPQELYDQARQLEVKLQDLQDEFDGDDFEEQREQVKKISISRRVRSAAFASFGQTYGPTETHRQQIEIGRSLFESAKERLESLLDDEYAALLEALDDADAPWTPGRPLP